MIIPFKEAVASFPEALVASDEEVFARVWPGKRSVTYREFRNLVAGGAEALRERGVREGDRIALLAKGTFEFYVCVVSTQCIGTPVCLNWRQSRENLRGMVEDAGCGVVVAGDPYRDLARQLGVENVVDLEDVSTSPTKKLNYWKGNTEAAVFFTSGSTSRPKPVLHTNRTLLWTVENFVFPPNTTSTLCFMPNFHVLMCFQNFLLPLARGGVGVSIHKNDATTPVTARLLLEAAADLRPSTIDTVPFIMAEWSTLAAADLAPLAACAAVRSGGAPLFVAVADRLVAAAGIRVQTHYGQTEAPGMQLLTVPGAAPDELAIMRPPWKGGYTGVEIKLSDRGELLLKCPGASPGYLEKGRLLAEKKEWHRTGDVFERVTTKGGVEGLRHVMRVDDVILLCTGEMFNPVPFEAAIPCRCVVLGQNRPSPFLVVETTTTTTTTEEDSFLWSLVEKANSREVEYARIRKGHVLKVERLPRSAKGNVVRPQAEALFKTQLDALAEKAEIERRYELERAAIDAGVSVEAYAADVGIDSLGVATLMRRGQREADRIGDNVKAWTVTAIVMSHWYITMMLPHNRDEPYPEGHAGGELLAFSLAKVGAPYRAVSYGVQFAVGVLSLCTGFQYPDGLIPVMLPLIASVAYSDSIRDAGVAILGRREITMVLLILFFKCVVMPYTLYVYEKRSWKPDSFYLQAPLAVGWYVYLLLYFRLVLRAARACGAGFRVLLAGCGAWLFLTNEGYICAFCTITWFRGSESLNALLAFVFDYGTYVAVRHSLTTQTPDHLVGGWLAIASSGPRYTHGFEWMQPKIITLFLPYVVFYYYGHKIVDASKRWFPRAGVNVVLCYAINALWSVILLSWASSRREFGLPRTPNRLRDHDAAAPGNWIDHVSKTIWHHENHHAAVVMAEWKPAWARPFYLLIFWFFAFATAFLCFAACVAMPFHMNRCGNAALGKYFSTFLFPQYITIFGYATAALGRHHAGLVVQVAQICLLCLGPLAFVYIWGPVATAIIVAFPRFVIWLAQSPSSDDVRNWVSNPGFRAFWAQYLFEVRRDLAALRAWLLQWYVDPLGNCASLLSPFSDLLSLIRGGSTPYPTQRDNDVDDDDGFFFLSFFDKKYPKPPSSDYGTLPLGSV
ncbi:hypothetical protein CTAYLR_003475 [Chrysophaeum taylorii]|uniref:AMP-dependent synthetase/ligase domain-containing protein n=1 Tax=Chrysophaeum taylorii TaxID=2483200 RepID=A0AAD7U907_9STRA|nr:hypothetical protein CTAYLR_003475 [Chrysophaeum taylorii]